MTIGITTLHDKIFVEIITMVILENRMPLSISILPFHIIIPLCSQFEFYPLKDMESIILNWEKYRWNLYSILYCTRACVLTFLALIKLIHFTLYVVQKKPQTNKQTNKNIEFTLNKLIAIEKYQNIIAFQNYISFQASLSLFDKNVS